MKKHLSKKLFWQSMLSAIVLGIIILMAVGSFYYGEEFVIFEDLGGGVIKRTTTFDSGKDKVETFVGKGDGYNRWDGPVTITTENKERGITKVEEVNMIAGLRHGESKTTINGGFLETHCYDMGEKVECTKTENLRLADVSAFQILEDKYPWFLSTLNVFDFDNNYVEAYLDTLELILSKLGDDPLEFEDYYADAVDSLTYTPYDSIIQLNDILTTVQGGEQVKNDEFRMATIDRYRSEGNTTYQIIKNTYPGYLQSIIELGITDHDFEGFCNTTDSLMDEDDEFYGSLDLMDPFFTDSVDFRLYRAVLYILEFEDTASAALKSMKIRAMYYDRNDLGAIYRDVYSAVSQTVIDSTTQNAASAFLYLLILKYNTGDMMYKAAHEAGLIDKAIVRVPTVTTVFSSNNSSTSVTLEGHVIEDGGEDVSSRGMAWADFYNPTTSDHMETSGSGLGTFPVTLNHLTEGTTYYARTYATNSAGTAYGNCLIFTAGGAVGVIDTRISVPDLNIYPNPTSGLTTLSFHIESPENMEMTLVNLKGQAVYHHDLGILPPGENRVELDVSGFQNGIYHCLLNSNGRVKASQKIFIVH